MPFRPTPSWSESPVRTWYVREGEIAYVITTPSDYVPSVEPTIVIPERRPWWKMMADFLTGEDLVSR